MKEKIMDKRRDELIKEMGSIRKHHDGGGGYSHNLSYTMKRWELELIADFILERDKKNAEPLVETKQKILKYSGLIGWITLTDTLTRPIDETLKRLGHE